MPENGTKKRDWWLSICGKGAFFISPPGVPFHPKKSEKYS
jgi:hypothetical protein